MADAVIEYMRKLNADLVSQFRDQPKIGGFMSAVAKQMQAIRTAQEQLNALRWLQSAEGRQLDGIGDIVVMSRAQAAEHEIGKPDGSAVNDAVYRKYLYYKMFLNTSDGTRRDVMKALRFFWNEAPLYYSEDLKYPATIFVSTPELAPDVPIEGLLEAPIVKPAGVRFIIFIKTRTLNDLQLIRHRGLSVVKITETRVLDVEQPAVSEHLRHKASPQWKVTVTQVGETETPALPKQTRHKSSPQWKITRTATGGYIAVAEAGQQYHGLATVKITNTPLAAYGGD